MSLSRPACLFSVRPVCSVSGLSSVPPVHQWVYGVSKIQYPTVSVRSVQQFVSGSGFSNSQCPGLPTVSVGRVQPFVSGVSNSQRRACPTVRVPRFPTVRVPRFPTVSILGFKQSVPGVSKSSCPGFPAVSVRGFQQ